jgi:Amt family ammonium transporter
VVAGLVAITPSCGYITPLGAMVVGLVAGAICAAAVGLKYKLGYDDSLDVVGVHLVGGLVGTILIGLLASKVVTDVDGLFYGGGVDQLGRQLVASGAAFAFSFVVTALIALALDKSVGFRIDEEHELTGLDQVLHAETAYDLNIAGGARTHAGG